jgi:hypothetical protein
MFPQVVVISAELCGCLWQLLQYTISVFNIMRDLVSAETIVYVV